MSCKVTGITALTAAITLAVAHGIGPSVASAQTTDEAEENNTREIVEDLAEKQLLEDPVHYGVGLRLRYVVVPAFMVNLFVEDGTGGVANPGVGLDFVRRRGDFELTVGIEYESLNGTDGFFLEKGDDGLSPGETPDFVEFDGFGWITLDANFVFHKPLGKSQFAVRYGGGFGLGLMLGEILQTDSVCSGTDINGGDCVKNPNPGGQVNDPASVPPVFPVVNALLGLQFRPIPQLLINAELGIRTAPFIGISSQYLF